MMKALLRYLCLCCVVVWGVGSWLFVGCSASECRLDIDCLGNDLCLQGRCTPYGQDGGSSTRQDPSTSCKTGAKRPCYRGPPGTAGVGICKAGEQTCLGDRWGVCEGEILPIQESCNNQDNDCNGSVDDGKFGGESCLVPGQKGPCERGIEACVGGQLICQQTVQPAQEVCGDGLDNNCNGQIDEKPPCTCQPGTTQPCYDGPTETRKKGSCQDGVQTCTPQQTWSPCTGSLGPQQEVCDGKDNDCDGKTDEDLTRSCEAKCGSGTQSCVGGQWQGCQAPTPTAETCDGKDNDCDGQTDEDLTQPCNSPCGPGTQTCRNGQWESCVGPTPEPETCDGKDNDCDGKTDEDLTRSCSTACGSGTQTCVGGQWQGCNGTAPTQEVCDNKDNDCNGKIDDNVRRTCSNDCGTGTEICLRGRWFACSAPRPSTEICDGKDNDCNGKTDETSAAAKRISTDLTQSYLSLAAVWNGSYFGTVYGYKQAVYFQRWTKEGYTVGSPVQLQSSTTPLSTQLLWNGQEFAAVWYTYQNSAYTFSFARISSLGKVITVQTLSHIKGANSAIRMAWNGTNYGLVWTDSSPKRVVRFGRLDQTGQPVGSTVAVTDVNTSTAPYLPDIAALNSSFGITWYERRNNVQDVYFQQLTSTGSKSGSEINISSSSASSYYPRIAASRSYYLVAFIDARSGSNQIYARRVYSNGTASSLTRQLSNNVKTPLALDLQSLSSTSLYFGIVWGDYRTSPRQLWFAKLSFSGLLSGSEIQVSQTTQYTSYHAIAPIDDKLVGIFWIDSSTGRGQIYFRGLCGF